MEKLLKKYCIEDECPGFAEYYEAARRAYAELGDEIMRFEKYPIFTHMEGDIRRIRDQLLCDGDNLLYAYFLNAAIRAEDNAAIRALSSPRKADESELYDTLPLFSLLHELPGMIAEHKRRGVPEDVTAATLEMFQNQIGDFILLNGRIGISAYVSWMLAFVRCNIIRVGRFNLEIRKYKSAYKVFTDGKDLCAMPEGVSYHRSGRVLGSAGCEDEDGSFSGELTETETAYTGITVKDGLAVNCAVTLPKSEWSLALSTGDTVVSVHIPSGGPMSPDIVEADLRRGAQIIRSCFCDFDFFYCSSWLLDIDIKRITGKEGNVTAFGDRFMRFPVKSNGGGVYEYVFNKRGTCPPETLVATNSFSRAIKEHLCAGGFVYGAEGIMRACK